MVIWSDLDRENPETEMILKPTDKVLLFLSHNDDEIHNIQ